MGAPRALTSVSGQTEAGAEIIVQGEEALRTVRVHPDLARVVINRNVIPPRVELVLSSTGFAADIATINETLAAHTSAISGLQAKQWVTTSIKIADYDATAWQHVIVDIKTAAADVTITLPAPAAGSSRVRVTEISSDGGVASGLAMKIAASFWAGGVDGHWAVSPYIVANNGFSASLVGASIELLDLGVGVGWIVVDESCQQQQLV